jgi:uncharacterized protein
VRATNYQRRVVDDELDALISRGAAAVALEGANGVGKSATAAERVDQVFLLEDPGARELLRAQPTSVLNGAVVLIDEWQHLPLIWDVVRSAVDRGAEPGRFLLTGSASTRAAGVHSGVGKIPRIRMRPMTLVEREVDWPTVSLATLLSGGRKTITGETTVDLRRYVDEIVRSGFPALRRMDGQVRREQLSGYIERVIERDFRGVTGRGIRNPAGLRRWLMAYAAATATVTSYERVRRAATSRGAEPPAKTTTIPYRGALDALCILDPVPAWIPSNHRIAELAISPKHHLVDPALAASVLGLGPHALLSGGDSGLPVGRDGAFLGCLFESLVTLGVRVFAQACEASVGHLRTHRGDHEVDLIVERGDRVVAMQVKLGGSIDDEDVQPLHWLANEIGPDLHDAAVITTGPTAYRRQDGIAVVPAALLGP